jgi:hypothetical protein
MAILADSDIKDGVIETAMAGSDIAASPALQKNDPIFAELAPSGLC